MDINLEFCNAPLRAESVFHLGTQLVHEHIWPNDLDDVFNQDWEEVWKAIGYEGPEEYTKDAIFGYTQDHLIEGFLVQFATPVPKVLGKAQYSFSWNMYTTKWFYGENYQKLCKQALKWQENYIKEKLKSK